MTTSSRTTFDIQRLLDARAYSHPVTHLQLMETHISWIVLTGEWAYKLKKPVNFGFLDYSTLDRRRFFCEEEVRLNGRYAPDLYREAVPITWQEDGLRVGGPGPAVEYAVRMREFSQDGLFNIQVAEGRLQADKVDKLARLVARIHSQAARAPEGSEWGTPLQVQQPARDNFEVLRKLEGAQHESLDSICEWTERAFQKLAPVFEQRKADGFVRELHGDLHLGNVAEWNGEPVPFDGIEFDPGLRWLDTMSDFAFLVSDLQHHDRPDLGRLALDAYLEETGDYAGMQVWKYYVLYRWMVRAKVAALRKGQDHPELASEIALYLDQAVECLPTRPPTLLLMHGVSGCGKTVLSRWLVEHGNFLRVRSDVFRKRLSGLSPLQSSGSGLGTGLYTADKGQETYNALAQATSQLLQSGYSVVVDATFLRFAQRDQFHQLARSLSVPCCLVERNVPLDTLRERVAERRGDASEADLAVLEYQLQSQEPLREEELRLTLGAELPHSDGWLAELERSMHPACGHN